MEAHLENFRERLKPLEGSLVRPAQVSGSRSKHYLGWLARKGAVERVTWGWYYVPARRQPRSAYEFLARDRGFKVVTGQSAASFWNGDFVHREAVVVAVEDSSYARALRAFGQERGWQIEAEHDPNARKIPTRKAGGLRIEAPEETVVDCIRRWAFVDAVATLTKDMPFDEMRRRFYWRRIRGSDVRVGQALEYAAHGLFGVGRKPRVADRYVREELDEAIWKVKEIGQS